MNHFDSPPSANRNDAAFNAAPEADTIAHWRDELRQFFEVDWQELQGLILRLEEASWADDEHAVPADLPEPRLDRDTLPSRPDRLADLTRSLEERLRAASDHDFPIV